MTFALSVQGTGDPLGTVLGDGKHQIGSGPACTIQISHPEVSPIAAVVEVSGGVVFLQNCNEFPIFVGADELAPRAIAEWRPGSVVQLTLNVALALESTDVAAPSDKEPGDEEKNPVQTVVQAAVIALCALGSVWMLTSEQQTSPREDVTVINFDQLITKFEATGGKDLRKLKREQRVLLGYLTEARALETRWGGDKNEEAHAAYQLVLAAHSSQDDELAEDAKQYAASRIHALR